MQGINEKIIQTQQVIDGNACKFEPTHPHSIWTKSTWQQTLEKLTSWYMVGILYLLHFCCICVGTFHHWGVVVGGHSRHFIGLERAPEKKCRIFLKFGFNTLSTVFTIVQNCTSDLRYLQTFLQLYRYYKLPSWLCCFRFAILGATTRWAFLNPVGPCPILPDGICWRIVFDCGVGCFSGLWFPPIWCCCGWRAKNLPLESFPLHLQWPA